MRITDLSAGLAAFTLLSPLALPQGGPTSPSPQIHVPDRPGKPLFAGQQGRQTTEIHYDPKTGLVRLSLVVQDSNGYFIPDIRRANFAVYENGVRQRNATVEIEHAAVCVGVRVELVDSRTGGPLRIVDADAKPVHPRALVEGRYDPAATDSRTHLDR